MIYVIIFFFLLMGIFYPKSKKAFVIITVTAIFVTGGYNGTIDLAYYLDVYNFEIKGTKVFQNGYFLIANLFHRMGVSFELYHMIIVASALLLVAFCVYKLSNNYAYCISIIVFFATWEIGWQIKTASAVGIITFALYWYYNRVFENKSFYTKIVYIILVFLAAQFHFLSLFFLSFLFLEWFFKRNVSIIVIGCIDIVLFVYIDVLKHYLQGVISALAGYGARMSVISTIITISWQIALSLLVIHSAKNEMSNKFSRFIRQGTILMLFIIPAYRITVVATRIVKIWMIFVAIYFSNKRRNKSVVDLNRLYYSVYQVISFSYWYVFLGWYTNVVPLSIELVTNNIFF